MSVLYLILRLFMYYAHIIVISINIISITCITYYPKLLTRAHLIT